MKDYYAFLFVLSTTLLIILALALVDPVETASGKLHADYGTMIQSSNSQFSSASVKYLGYAFGLCIIGIFTLCLLLGAKKANDKGFKNRDILIGMGLYLTIFTAMVMSSWEYDSVEAPIVGGLPVPTAWMLYGIWFVPVVLIILYVWGFERFVISPEEEAAFQKIVENRAARNGAD
ncbi:MAG: hypothetical protein AAF696_01990 [Bacteroidota bacterium]